MAVLSVQLVFSMVTASLLSKLSPDFSFARWILCSKLVRYAHPTDAELKSLAGIGNNKGHGKKNKYVKPKEEAFTVPKNLDLQLDVVPISKLDVLPLHFYTEYQWLIDFTLCSICVYILTEVYYAVLCPTDFNLSMMWCLLVVGFSLKILLSLTAMYFNTDESSERIMCVIFGFFFLILAMGVLITGEDILEFGLEPGYTNFSSGATDFLKMQGIESNGPATFLTFRICLAILAGFLGCFLTFPGLRLAKMHLDAIKYAGERPILQVMLNVNMLLPLLVSLMWIKPITRDILVRRGSDGNLIMEPERFESIRILLIFAFCMVRFCLIWPHLQAHLNLAVERVEALKKEAGRISSIALQKMITRVYYYLCIVALQYITPLVLILFLTLMMKTMGEISVLEPFNIPMPTMYNLSQVARPVSNASADSITSTAVQFSLAFTSLRQVFTPLAFKGFFSFLCWWINTVWFATAAFGLAYHRYFTD